MIVARSHHRFTVNPATVLRRTPPPFHDKPCHRFTTYPRLAPWMTFSHKEGKIHGAYIGAFICKRIQDRSGSCYGDGVEVLSRRERPYENERDKVLRCRLCGTDINIYIFRGDNCNEDLALDTMRQRKIKNIDDKLDVFSDIIIERG